MDHIKSKGPQNLPNKYNKDGEIGEPDLFAFILKRTAKLSSALYLVTNLISDAEPIKWKLREMALSMLSDIASLRHEYVSERTPVFSKTISALSDILALLEVARVGGLVSEMNFSIMKREYEKLAEIMKGKGVMSDQMEEPIRELLEAGDTAEQLLAERRAFRKKYSKGHYKGHADVLKKGDVLYDRKKGGEPGGQPVPMEIRTKMHVPGAAKEASKTERRNIILDLAKEKGSINVKDVSVMIPDLSEKTIQRELIALVKENVLKKEGEKRWSRYSLI